MSDAQTTRMVTLPEAQRILGVSKRTAQRMLADGRLRGTKKGSRWLVEMPADVKQALPSDTDALAKLRQDVAVLTSQRDALASERDYLRNALAAALTPHPPALPEPRTRWRWPWQR
jgi:excisionase family DNA binding protein